MANPDEDNERLSIMYERELRKLLVSRIRTFHAYASWEELIDLVCKAYNIENNYTQNFASLDRLFKKLGVDPPRLPHETKPPDQRISLSTIIITILLAIIVGTLLIFPSISGQVISKTTHLFGLNSTPAIEIQESQSAPVVTDLNIETPFPTPQIYTENMPSSPNADSSEIDESVYIPATVPPVIPTLIPTPLPGLQIEEPIPNKDQPLLVSTSDYTCANLPTGAILVSENSLTGNQYLGNVVPSTILYRTITSVNDGPNLDDSITANLNCALSVSIVEYCDVFNGTAYLLLFWKTGLAPYSWVKASDVRKDSQNSCAYPTN